jgi:hypothetical protein
MYETRVAKIREEFSNYIDVFTALGVPSLPKRYCDLAMQLNADPDGKWTNVLEEIVLRVNIDFDGESISLSTRVQIHSLPIPKRTSSFWLEIEIEAHHPMYPEISDIFRRMEAARREANSLKDALVEDVMTKCTTLKQVLEVWPSALDFMPDEVKTRHYEQTSRKAVPKKEKIVVSAATRVALIKALMLKDS